MYVDFMGHFISSLFFFPRFYVLPYFRPTLTYTKFSTNSQSDEVEQQRHPVGARTHTQKNTQNVLPDVRRAYKNMQLGLWTTICQTHTKTHTTNTKYTRKFTCGVEQHTPADSVGEQNCHKFMRIPSTEEL